MIERAAEVVAETSLSPARATAAKKRKKAPPTPRVLPSRLFPDAKLFVGHTRGKYVMKLLKHIGCFACVDVVLDFSAATGLKVRQVNSTNTFLADLLVPRAAFAAFEVATSSGSLSYKLSYEHIQKFEKAVAADQTISFSDIDDGKLIARVCGSRNDSKRTLPTKDIDPNDEHLHLPYRETRYPVEVHMPTAEFARLVSACESTGANFIEFGVVTRDSGKRVLTFAALVDDSASLIDGGWEDQYVPDSIDVDVGADEFRKQAYSVIYLKIIASLAPIASRVTMRFGLAMQPLHCSFSVPAEDEKRDEEEDGDDAGGRDASADARIDVLLMGRTDAD